MLSKWTNYLCRPCRGSDLRFTLFPRLTPWATLFRPYGAGFRHPAHIGIANRPTRRTSYVNPGRVPLDAIQGETRPLQLPIQPSIMNRFGHMICHDVRRGREVGDRPGDAQNLVVSAGRKP